MSQSDRQKALDRQAALKVIKKPIKCTEDIVSIAKREGAFVVLKKERQLVEWAMKAVKRGVLKQIAHRSYGDHIRFEPEFTTTDTGGKNYAWY